MRKSLFIFGLIWVTQSVALASPCNRSDFERILAGLDARASDSSKAEEEREKADFVQSIIISSRHLDCNKDASGSVYEVQTSTHNFTFAFSGSQIVKLSAQRTRFN